MVLLYKDYDGSPVICTNVKEVYIFRKKEKYEIRIIDAVDRRRPIALYDTEEQAEMFVKTLFKKAANSELHNVEAIKKEVERNGI